MKLVHTHSKVSAIHKLLSALGKVAFMSFIGHSTLTQNYQKNSALTSKLFTIYYMKIPHGTGLMIKNSSSIFRYNWRSNSIFATSAKLTRQNLYDKNKNILILIVKSLVLYMPSRCMNFSSSDLYIPFTFLTNHISHHCFAKTGNLSTRFYRALMRFT